MKIILDDWLVIVEWKGKTRIFNTELWQEWGNVGVQDTTDNEKNQAELSIVRKALEILARES